jgi:predicted XRE-type DNA-binding protein
VKPLYWIGSSKEDLCAFPEEVRRNVGYALHFAQAGDRHPSAKPLKGFGGAAVLEVVEDQAGVATYGSKAQMSEKDVQVTEGNGNVFEDLGLPEADQLQVKAELTRQIYNIIHKRRLTQVAAGRLLGLKQPDISALMRGRFIGFSTDRLIKLLTTLDRDVDIIIKRKPRSRSARVNVTAA